jgi:hypothetical protein
VLCGPDLGLPSQVLRGSYYGPPPTEDARIGVTDPTGLTVYHWVPVITTTQTITEAWGYFLLDASVSGDEYFGTGRVCLLGCEEWDEECGIGEWKARARYEDPWYGPVESNEVSWQVSWFPVHVIE